MNAPLMLCVSLFAAFVATAAIDEAAAVKAAMTHAGVKEVGAHALYAAPDEEDGHPIYEIRFHDGTTAYAYEVSALDGTLLKANRRALPKPAVAVTPQAQTGDVGAERVKAVALADVKATGTPSRIKVERDFEQGRLVYEVEFRLGNVEYEYVIDASNGTILKREAERKRGLF